MADGSQTIEPKKPERSAGQDDHLTPEQFDQLSICVSKGLAIADVMAVAATEGDAESFHKDSLSTALLLLTEILQDAREILDASIDASIATRNARQDLAHAEFEAGYAARLEARNRPA